MTSSQYARKSSEEKKHFHEVVLQNKWARRARAIQLLGGKCCKCGFDDPRALQIDHINGGGSSLAEQRGFRHAERDILAGRNLDHYQLLCANCNFIKRHEECGYHAF